MVYTVYNIGFISLPKLHLFDCFTSSPLTRLLPIRSILVPPQIYVEWGTDIPMNPRPSLDLKLKFFPLR